MIHERHRFGQYTGQWTLGLPDDELLPPTAVLTDLIARAHEVRRRAHVPVSGFRVGSALLAGSGRIFSGCNVEASNGTSICAERAALVAAVAEGENAFSAVASVADTPAPLAPCGQCRQHLSDFAPSMVVVMLTTRSSQYELARMSDLFPRPNFKGRQ